MIPNQYERRALLPAALIMALPGLIVWVVLPVDKLVQINALLAVKFGGDAVLGLIAIYPGTQIVRWLGVWLVQRLLYGSFGLGFPTQTLLLLNNGELDLVYKKRVRQELVRRYGTVLPSRRAEVDREMALKVLQGSIRSAKREFGSDEIVFRENAAYGFARSLVGGAVLGLIMSIVGSWWLEIRVNDHFMTHIMLALTVLYVFVLIFGWLMVRGAAHRYAIALFDAILEGNRP